MQPSRLKLKWMLPIAICVLAGAALAWQETNSGNRRLYVEAFATKADAERLREDVSAELRKLPSVSLVPDESSADLILGGGGEVWVRGYRSFSSRSHMKLPTNGTPIYGGYLSVELKNKHGVTVWSDLVTPGTAPEDISKDLSKRIAKHLVEGLNQAQATRTPSPRTQPTIALNGAGATFPSPVYLKWFTNFQMEDPGTLISYDAIGSEGGIRKPLPGVPEDIAFTPEALAGIFLGKIRKWNAPILSRANRGLHLPDLDIVVVHRADGSGTSYAWTDYLSRTNPEWKGEVGSNLAPKWPTGRGATGNDGVAKLVKELGGSIGYVEFIYALQNHLSYGRIRNENDELVQASLESIAAAVGHSARIRDDFKASIVDAPGAGAYPIASFTWIVVPTHVADEAKRSAITTFLIWMLGPGQRQAAALGYLALPREIVAKEQEAIARIH